MATEVLTASQVSAACSVPMRQHVQSAGCRRQISQHQSGRALLSLPQQYGLPVKRAGTKNPASIYGEHCSAVGRSESTFDSCSVDVLLRLLRPWEQFRANVRTTSPAASAAATLSQFVSFRLKLSTKQELKKTNEEDSRKKTGKTESETAGCKRNLDKLKGGAQ